jgi:hypothetical protein
MTAFLSGRIYHLADDHARIDHALQRATRQPETIAPDAYAEFRAGLLRHIGMEEKILLPAVFPKAPYSHQTDQCVELEQVVTRDLP